MNIPRSAVGLLCVACGIGAHHAQEATPRKGFSVTITAPENQAIVFGKTRLAAEVQIGDPTLIDRVEFRVGDEVVFVDREPPFECRHDFGEQSRSWVVRVVAYHREAVSTEDAIITRKPAFAVVERVNRVLLWASAEDKDGALVSDLTRERVRVLENGREQQIVDFYREERPITLAILIDTSGSMKDKLKQVREAAKAFVDTLRPEDRALVIDFDDKVYLIQELTSDRDALKEAILSIEAIGGTSLYDVLHAAQRKIGSIDGYKAIVLLSDGEDTSSQFSYERVLEEAKSNDTLIFSIGLGGGGEGPRKNVLKEFSDTTGGRAFFANKAEELAGVYERIAEELRQRYFISYTTTNEVWDGRWIPIEVEPVDSHLEIRARRGYFAVRKSML